MRVFVTGATGFVGSAIVKDLIQAGHQVLGLARNGAASDALKQLGAEAHRGDLTDLESLAAGARASEGVIHTAYNNDFSQFAAAGETDRRVVEALGTALAGSGRPLVITSAIGMLSPGRPTSEDDAGDPNGPGAVRLPSEEKALALSSEGVRSSIIRLPLMVHDRTKQGLATSLIGLARQTGVSAYVDDGVNRWPAVHRLDAARVYRLALERGATPGQFHAVAEEGVPFKEIAEVIGRRLNIPVVSKSPAEVAEHFGWFAMFAGIDAPTSSARTRAKLGWKPELPGLIADIDHPAYFAQR
jgi:nucleoside-diphosphate-sugar epimerase